MGLFKSAAEKRIEEKMLVKKAMGNIKRYIEKLENAKRNYIEEAKEAKKHGIDSQYRLARSGLAMAVRQQQVAEQLLLNLELNQQTKDASEVTSDFVKGMDTLGKEINAQSARINVSKAQKNMRTALAGNELTQERLEGFMDESEMLFGSVAADTGLNSELDALIAREAGLESEDTSVVDAEIDAMLRSAKGI